MDLKSGSFELKERIYNDKMHKLHSRITCLQSKPKKQTKDSAKKNKAHINVKKLRDELSSPELRSPLNMSPQYNEDYLEKQKLNLCSSSAL